MSAEEYLNKELKGCYQTYTEDGITLISGIEHSEICQIMESYHKHRVESITKESLKSIVPDNLWRDKPVKRRIEEGKVKSTWEAIKQELLKQQ